MGSNKLGMLFQAALKGKDLESNKPFLRKIRPSSIVLFSDNFNTAGELDSLIREVSHFYRSELSAEPPLFSIDQEGGNVIRAWDIPFPPSNMAVGATGDEKLAYYSGLLTGYHLRLHGVEWNLAPVLDVNDSHDNPIIGIRSYGDDPDFVSLMGNAYIRGLKAQGCLSTAKHFPGHGSVSVDSHIDLPVDERDAEEIRRTALPFARALESGVDTVMVSHLYYPSLTGEKDLPATLSRDVITGLLRNELGCNVPVLTDSLSMGAVKKHFPPSESALMAVRAGADIIEDTDQDDVEEMYSSIAGRSDSLDAILSSAFKRVERLFLKRAAPSVTPDGTLQHLIRTSVTSLGPQIQSHVQAHRKWAVYDCEVTVGGRKYLPLSEALAGLGIEYVSGAEGTDGLPALVLMYGEHLKPHNDLRSIRSRHGELYAIGAGTPYDAGVASGLPYLTGYAPNVQSVKACLEALFGLFTPRGKPPVRLKSF